MSEFIPAATPADPSKLLVIATVKASFKGALAYIMNNWLLTGLFLIFVIFEYSITKGAKPLLNQNEFSLLGVIYGVISVSVNSFMIFSIIRFHLNHSKMTFSETIKSKGFQAILLLILAIIIAFDISLIFMNDVKNFALTIPTLLFVLFVIYFMIKTIPYYGSHATFLEPALTLKEAFRLTSGNFWRIVLLCLLILLPGFILITLNEFTLKLDDFHSLHFIITCLMTCYIYISLNVCNAIIFKHLTEKAHA